jgi:hypothetical protein
LGYIDILSLARNLSNQAECGSGGCGGPQVTGRTFGLSGIWRHFVATAEPLSEVTREAGERTQGAVQVCKRRHRSGPKREPPTPVAQYKFKEATVKNKEQSDQRQGDRANPCEANRKWRGKQHNIETGTLTTLLSLVLRSF